jgi:penicillin-binding protein 1A
MGKSWWSGFNWIESGLDKTSSHSNGSRSATVRRRRPSSLATSRTSQPQEPGALPPRRPLYFRPAFWLTLLLTAGLAGGSTRVYRVWQATNANLPDPTQALTYERNGTITVVSADGVILQKMGPASRETIDYDDIPRDIVEAFIASEDQRFYEHNGIDKRGIMRAVYANVMNRGVVEGASTITQQLARIVFLDQERSFQRKAREALLALKMEENLDKSQILERYLNLVYLGAGAYGIADAAWIYFGKTIDDLTLAESALIAGMAPAPSLYSPTVDPAAARQQRDRVIQRMLSTGAISQAEADTAMATEVAINPKEPKYLYSEFPYFTIYVEKQLAELISPDQLEAGGLTVETSLNVDWQRKAEQTVNEAIERYSGWQGFEQVALVAVDPRNGEIKAMVGGNDFNESQFNRVTQAQRQPGSTFKAFVYTTAVAAGFSPYKGYEDAKYVVDGYEPKNYGESYSGSVDMLRALRSSINIVAVKVLVDVGFEPVINMAERMGIQSELLPTYSLALGASEVNLLELTSAYGTLANQGKHVPVHGIRRVLDSEGNVIYEIKPEAVQAVDQDTANIMTWMLRGVVEGGTGRNAYLGRPVAGKTGTSEKNRDLWFIGYIPQLATGVWMGNDDSSPTNGASSTAAAVWRMFMSQLTDDIPVEQFPERPRLGGRDGTIEAQPVKPGKVVAARASSSSDDSESTSSRSNNRNNQSGSDSNDSGSNTSSEGRRSAGSNRPASNPNPAAETAPARNAAPAPSATPEAPNAPAPVVTTDPPTPTAKPTSAPAPAPATTTTAPVPVSAPKPIAPTAPAPIVNPVAPPAPITPPAATTAPAPPPAPVPPAPVESQAAPAGEAEGAE